MWRSWLAHLVWDQRVLCSSHSTPTKRQLSDGSCFFLYNFGAVDSSGNDAIFRDGVWKSDGPSTKSGVFVDRVREDMYLSTKRGVFVDGVGKYQHLSSK